MPTSAEIVLHVDPATAEAYEAASSQQKERLRSLFALALLDRQEAADEALRFFDEVARNAQARGLTPEILDEILREDPSGEGRPDPEPGPAR